MAFNSAQKVKIRTYLGFALGFYDLNTRLESMMDTVGADADAQTHVEGILAELLTVDAALASSGSTTTSAGSLKKVDDVEWYDTSTSTTGASTVTAPERGKMLINRLAACFGFRTDELPSNYFAAGSSSGNEMALG